MRQLSPEETEFLQNFRGFLKKEIAPHEADWDEAGSYPKEIFEKFAQIGYLGLLHEESVGGADVGLVLATHCMEALAEVSGSCFFSIGASAGLFGLPLHHFGTPSQKAKYLPDILKGKTIGCLAVTEPDGGSDVSGLVTKVAETPSGKFILDGQKTYITNSTLADFAVVLARFTNKEGKDLGLTHFLADLHLPGVSRSTPMKKMGLRSSQTGALFFEGVEIGGEETILGGKGKGFRQTMQTFNLERLSIAAYSLGVMNACLEESRKFASTRKSFGKPINQHQAIQHYLAEMFTDTEAVRSFTYRVAGEMEDAELTGKSTVGFTKLCAAVKLFASEKAREVANLAVQIHGGGGYMDEYRVSRLYRDVRLAEIGGGTSEIQKSIIGS